MRWSFSSPDAVQVEALRAEAKVSPIVARLLALRGITAAEAANFLSPSLDHLHSPYLMRGMTAAVERLSAAIANKEGILIYGDYDVDGTTAVVILKTAIELCGGVADFHVPHRIKEGYGIKDDVIERAAAGGIRVVISVDTGIRAFQAAETARRVGIDLIVTDHHLPEAPPVRFPTKRGPTCKILPRGGALPGILYGSRRRWYGLNMSMTSSFTWPSNQNPMACLRMGRRSYGFTPTGS